jgi:Clr5 domain
MSQPEAKVTSSKRVWATRTEWDLQKATITRLYIEENMTLRKVMKIMEEKHNFIAT